MIFNMPGGGKKPENPLNFEIVGGTSQPSNPKENTIWVNTSTDIPSWVFSATEPETPVEGMVWFYVNLVSNVAFNALKENGLQVYPLSAKQYVRGDWEAVSSKTYQEEKWSEWAIYLHNLGDPCTSITGGWTNTAVDITGAAGSAKDLSVTTGTDNVTLTQTNPGCGGLYSTVNKIPTKGYTTLKFSGTIYNPASNQIKFAVMSSKESSGVVASKTYVNLGSTEIELKDETVLTLPSDGGDYYIGIGIGSTDGKYLIMKQLYLA